MYNGFVSSYNTTQFQGGHEVGGLTQFNNMNNTSGLNNVVVWQETRKLWYTGLEMLCSGGLIRESWCCCSYTTDFPQCLHYKLRATALFSKEHSAILSPFLISEPLNMKILLKARNLVSGKQMYHLPENKYRQIKTVPIRLSFLFVCASEMQFSLCGIESGFYV